jgi:hypothetical protein
MAAGQKNWQANRQSGQTAKLGWWLARLAKSYNLIRACTRKEELF